MHMAVARAVPPHPPRQQQHVLPHESFPVLLPV